MFRRVVAMGGAAVVVVGLTVAAAPATPRVGSVRAAVSLSGPAKAAYGTPISLGGVLWRYGTSTRIGNAPVVLQRAPHGKTNWATFTTGRTSSTGTFSFQVTQVGAYDYRAYYAGSTTYTTAASAVRYPVTTQNVLLDAITTSNAQTGQLTASGRVYPTPPDGSPVLLERWDATNKVWSTLAAGRATAGKATVTGTAAGSVSAYRLTAPQQGQFAADDSAARQFSHYVWRGALTRSILATWADGSQGARFLVDATDASRRTIDFWIAPTLSAKLELDTAGCVRVGSEHTDKMTGAHNYLVAFQAGTTFLAWKTFTGANPSERLDFNLPVGTDKLSFTGSDNTNGGGHARSAIQLLCAN